MLSWTAKGQRVGGYCCLDCYKDRLICGTMRDNSLRGGED